MRWSGLANPSVSVRLSEELQDYVKSQGDDFTKGLVRIIESHRELSFKADLEQGIGYLASMFKTVEFRSLDDNEGN